jgi:hypothetical protein
MAHPGYFRAMFHGDLGDLTDYAGLKQIAAKTFESLLGCVTRGVAAGVFVKGEPLQLAVMAWSTVHGLSMLLVDGRVAHPGAQSVDGAMMARSVTDLMMTGLLGRSDR